MTKLCDQLTKYVEHLMYGNKNIPRYYVFLTRFTEPLLTNVSEVLRYILNCLLVPTFSEPYLTTVIHFKLRYPVKQSGATTNGKPLKRTGSNMK